MDVDEKVILATESKEFLSIVNAEDKANVEEHEDGNACERNTS